jgi:AcrR family transcriptional regulator
VTADSVDPDRKNPGGRRPGESGTRDAILDAARILFADRGYEGASLRAIASGAGVDPALIRHFFGDKQSLFAATVADRTTLPERMLGAIAGDPRDVGRRFTDTYLRLWEDPDTRPLLHALVRSAATSQGAADMVVELLQGRMRSYDGVDDVLAQRISLAGAHLLGVAFARYVLRIPPLADLPHDDLVDEIAPSIQRYLSGTNR